MSSYWLSDDLKVSVKTFESYLRDAKNEGKIDHALRVSEDGNGNIQFYIHPANADGETLDYKVTGNDLWPAHEAFDKPDEKLVMFLKHGNGRMFRADAMTWHINTLDKLYEAVKAGDIDEAKKLSAEIEEAIKDAD